jgi:hypothetical protein
MGGYVKFVCRFGKKYLPSWLREFTFHFTLEEQRRKFLEIEIESDAVGV